MLNIKQLFAQYGVIVKESKYLKIYESLMNSPPDTEGYTETHHIIPKCISNDNKKSNLIEISGRKHFICHYLLCKILEKDTKFWYKLNHAFIRFGSNNLSGRYYNSRLYESKRKNFSSVMSKCQSGELNSQYGKIWICHPYSIKPTIISPNMFDEYYNQGWLLGRTIKHPKIKKISKREMENYVDPYKERALKTISLFLSGEFYSIKEFVETSNDNTLTVSNLSVLWSSKFPDYKSFAKSNMGVRKSSKYCREFLNHLIDDKFIELN
jgi:hypothetical protein